jgi:excisionase family DNA binding protein
MKANYIQTTHSDQIMAEASVPYLKKTTSQVEQNPDLGIKIRIQETGDSITIPKNAFLLLMDVLNKMANGKSFTILPSDSEITTQQAARILNVSRPFVVKMLDNGKIPFVKVGSHRRIKLTDILEYDKLMSDNRRKNLDLLAKQAQDLKLGYE